MILLYITCVIITFFAISAIFKRKRKNPDSILYKEDPEEMVGPILLGSLFWPVAIAGGVVVYIAIHLYKRWERWLNK
jgi:hypothetical protein